MVVSLLRQCEMSHAGAQRMLTVGQVCDLPDVVAVRLVNSGAAVFVEVIDGPATREIAAITPPESGKRRRRAA